MAVSQSKRSTHRAQPQRRAHSGKTITPDRNIVYFPQAQGKLLEGVEFSSTAGYHNISLNFQDKTCLNFVVDMGFSIATDYSDWKTGNQRVLHRWTPLRSYDWRSQRPRKS